MYFALGSTLLTQQPVTKDEYQLFST